MNSPVLEVRNLTKKISNKTIVEDVSFEINAGEIIGLLGPNGAGKTTTMKMIVGLEEISKGNIRFNSEDINVADKPLAEIGAIIETPHFYPFLTGIENLRYFSSLSKNVSDESLVNISKILELDKYLNVKVKNYSLGMKQRLGIAQALVHSPDLLVLDEPMNGLDPYGIITFRNYLKSLTKSINTSILISSHIISEIELLCDRVIFMQNGKVISTILPSQINDDRTKVSISTDNATRAILLLKQQFNLSFEENVLNKSEVIGSLESVTITSVLKMLLEKDFQIFEVKYYKDSLEKKYLQLTGGELNENTSVN